MTRELPVRISSSLIHALRDNGVTLCGMRPIKYQAFPGEAISCPACSSKIAERRQRPVKPHKFRGPSRTLQLTDKGHALVRKWEVEDE